MGSKNEFVIRLPANFLSITMSRTMLMLELNRFTALGWQLNLAVAKELQGSPNGQ
ncbi:hypothetical protein AMC99_02107 [Altererythrobacter epoxidivorans]|uniref:Uncharacterized protein n=1 Tax=Altererythrobacter epoxidivorans TaxID=361183 RepID=A0A0M4MI67_9SPHN|nr:hypothetical protein AMC99_02107 [Altererythrobacter epoxidivorans]